MRVRVVMRDKVGSDFFVREQIRLEVMSKRDTERIARECEKTIQSMIMEKADKPTGHLASKYLAEQIPLGWGVGDIPTLDAEAPYWNHLDKGSEGIGANWQHTLPKGYWEDGRWVEDDSGYFAVPKTPLPALNYIASTLAQMEVQIPIILRMSK